MKSLYNTYEGLLAGQDNTLSTGDKHVKSPEIALNVKCKNFKELIEMFANYFGVKTPKPTKKTHVEWDINYTVSRIYSDVDYVKFNLNDPNTGEHTLEIIDTGNKNKYPVFRLRTGYIDGVLRNRRICTVYGESGYSYSEYKYGDNFYKWLPREFKDWLEFNQNPG
jgi:hypothetical protein